MYKKRVFGLSCSSFHQRIFWPKIWLEKAELATLLTLCRSRGGGRGEGEGGSSCLPCCWLDHQTHKTTKKCLLLPYTLQHAISPKKIQKWASAHFQSRFETHFSFFPPSSLSSSSSEQSTSTYTVFPLHRAHVVWTGNLFASFQTWLHSTERRKKIPVVLFPNFFLFFCPTQITIVWVSAISNGGIFRHFFSLSLHRRKKFIFAARRERERGRSVCQK